MIFESKTRNYRNEDFREKLGLSWRNLEKTGLYKENFYTKEQLKKLYKIFTRHTNVSKVPYMINTWTVYGEDFESKKIVTVFERSKKAMKFIEENMQLKETWNTSPYDCSGQWYMGRVKIIETCDRIIIKQSMYLDV